MQTFEEWVLENHPDICESKFLNNLFMTAAMLGGVAAPSYANAGEPVKAAASSSSQQRQINDDVIERDGWVYVKGSAKSKGETPASRMKALRVAETKLMLNASKYFKSKGGREGFVPGGYKEITKSSDFLNGKIDHITWAWKIPSE